MKRIVVGTDLTPRSTGAVTMAADLARATGAHLHLVSATPAPVVAGEAAAIGAVPTIGTSDAKDARTDELDALAVSFRRSGIETETHSVVGSAADVLCQVAGAVEADLIVVGNRRMKGAGRILGSVPNRVAHSAPCSVLIARTGT